LRKKLEEEEARKAKEQLAVRSVGARKLKAKDYLEFALNLQKTRKRGHAKVLGKE
jgi:hypothetical protein